MADDTYGGFYGSLNDQVCAASLTVQHVQVT